MLVLMLVWANRSHTTTVPGHSTHNHARYVTLDNGSEWLCFWFTCLLYCLVIITLECTFSLIKMEFALKQCAVSHQQQPPTSVFTTSLDWVVFTFCFIEWVWRSAQCVQSPQHCEVMSQAFMFTPHSPDSSRAASSPAGPARGNRPVQVHHAQLSCQLLTGPFLCLDMFIYANTCHCVTSAWSIQPSNVLYGLAAQEW